MLIGVVIAICATLLPPPRMAGVDLEKQAGLGLVPWPVYVSLVVAWQHQPYAEASFTGEAQLRTCLSR